MIKDKLADVVVNNGPWALLAGVLFGVGLSRSADLSPVPPAVAYGAASALVVAKLVFNAWVDRRVRQIAQLRQSGGSV